MAGTTKTIDSDGNVTELSVSEPVITLSYSRKNNLGNYNNEEISAFVQIPLEEGTLDDAAALEKVLDKHAAFIKAWSFKQLGLVYGADEKTGVVTAVTPAVEDSKPAKRAAKGGSNSNGGGNADEAALWKLLANATQDEKGGWVNGDDLFYDNRQKIKDGEYSAKSPQFKHAGSGKGLWLNSKSKPEWFNGPGQGEEV